MAIHERARDSVEGGEIFCCSQYYLPRGLVKGIVELYRAGNSPGENEAFHNEFCRMWTGRGTMSGSQVRLLLKLG